MAHLQSIILCDRVYVDAPTGQMVIAGTFHQTEIEEYPAVFPEGATLYLAFRDVRGSCSIQLEYVDLANNETLLTFETIQLHSEDPYATVELAVPLPELPIPQAGPFAFDVFTGETFLGTFRLIAE